MKGYDTLRDSNAPTAPPPYSHFDQSPAGFVPQQSYPMAQQLPVHSYPMPQVIPIQPQTTINMGGQVERPSRCFCCCCSCPFWVCALIIALWLNVSTFGCAGYWS